MVRAIAHRAGRIELQVAHTTIETTALRAAASQIAEQAWVAARDCPQIEAERRDASGQRTGDLRKAAWMESHRRLP